MLFRNRGYLVATGMSALIAGAGFYFFARGNLGLVHMGVSTFQDKTIFWNNAPSFLHAFAFCCLSVAAGLNRRSSTMFWILFGSAWEVTQALFPALGTFDSSDIVASALGALSACAVSHWWSIDFPGRDFKLARGAIYGLALLTCMATSPEKKYPTSAPVKRASASDKPISEAEYFDHEPDYMTYDDLRKAFAVEAPRPIAKAGKITVLGTKLFVNEPNIGIHVFDNSDASAPKAIHFLSLPGNIDIAAKDGVLYADSFVDLVAIDLEGDDPHIVKRIEDTFAWDPYQAIDDAAIRFEPALVDSKRGVIVGARLKDKSNLKPQAAKQ